MSVVLEFADDAFTEMDTERVVSFLFRTVYELELLTKLPST